MASTGVLTVQATYNIPEKDNDWNVKDIAAFQLWNGQQVFTSDYVVPDAYGVISPFLGIAVDDIYYGTYERNQAITAEHKETAAFIEQFVSRNAGVSANGNLSFAYDNAQGLDLSKYVVLYAWDGNEFKSLEEMGFHGISYVYSLPENYLGADGTTNQQWFAQLNGSVISINTKNLKAPYTQAIGRKPVVRVDAYMPNPKGGKVMVATGYVKVGIVEKDLSGDNETIDVTMPQVASGYASNGNKPFDIMAMDYKSVNNQIYAPAGVTASTFWSTYNWPNIKVTVLGNDGKEKEVPYISQDYENGANIYKYNGVNVSLARNNYWEQTTTSLISVATTPSVHTESYVNAKGEPYYKNVDGKGAQYTVTLTFQGQQNKLAKDIVLTQVFYVKDNVVAYPLNPNYDQGNNTVKSKGKLVNNTWTFNMNIADAFKMNNNQNIFQYYNTLKGYQVVASEPSFTINSKPEGNTSGVKYENKEIYLTSALTAAQKSIQMTYNVKLKNGEEKNFPLNVIFENPFKSASNLKALSINGNSVATVTESLEPSVNVVDLSNAAIYSWIATTKDTPAHLGLSKLATETYKLTAPTVAYAFDTKEQAYKDFVGQLPSGASIKVVDGKVVYESAGASLVPSYTLHVNVTVTFGNISAVVCRIPVQVNGSGK